MISRKSIWALFIVLVLAVQAAPSIDESLSSIKEKASKSIKELSDNACILNEHCNTFFTLKNYCCGVQGCDVIKYITRNDNYWDNFAKTFEEPRAMNIILAILFTLIIVLLIGVIVKLVCCLFCGCCGTKKYVIVGRGD